jgi:hypothetical protein
MMVNYAIVLEPLIPHSQKGFNQQELVDKLSYHPLKDQDQKFLIFLIYIVIVLF